MRKSTNLKKTKILETDEIVAKPKENEIKKEENSTNHKAEGTNKRNSSFKITFELDILSMLLFLCALFTRIYKLEEPKNIV